MNGDVAVLPLIKHDACRHEARRGHDVDLVEREPRAHLIAVTCEHSASEALKHAHESAVAPTAVCRNKMHGHVIVAERHHRLDALFEAGAKHILIEREALLVGFGVIPVGEYTAPCDGEAQSLEAHLAEERDVLAVMMIEIDGLLGRVVMVGQRLERNVVTPDDGETVPPVRQKIRVGEPPPALVPGTLTLVGGKRAAPEKIRTQWHGSPPYLAFSANGHHHAAAPVRVHGAPVPRRDSLR